MSDPSVTEGDRVTLDETLAQARDLLAAAVTDRAAPFRNLVLSTIGADGAPSSRIVILRAFDWAEKRISVHTDVRSAKHAALLANPAVAVLAWDPALRLQLRLRGRARLHRGDAVAKAEWDPLRPAARRLYRERRLPGSALPDRSPRPEDVVTEAEGFAQFVVVRVMFDRLETLRLAGDGQIRAGFALSADGVTASWLVP